MAIRIISLAKIYLIFIVTIVISCAEKKEPVPVIKEEKTFWVGDTSSIIHGIDISHHQKTIDWNKVKESGISFVFVKATEGIDYLDSMFIFNWQSLESIGLIRGA